MQNNLLISIATLGSGGAERVLSVLSQYFPDHFEKVTIVLWENAEQFYPIDERIEIFVIPRLCNNNNICSKMLWFRKFVNSTKPNVILSFLYPYSIRVILSLIGTKSKIIAAERRDPRVVKGGRIVRFLRDILYTSISGVFVQSEYNKTLYPRFIQKKIDVLYNPILIPPKIEIGNRNLTPDKTIVSVGRLIPIKNHYLLIDAFTIFHKSHPDYKLIIWGDGPLKQDLIDYSITKGLKLSDNIEFPGNSPNIIKKIRSATAFVLTSKSEGMPNALYEAICSGIPSISTPVTGVMDLLQNGNNAIIVSDNVEELANAISEITDNRDLRNNISKNGEKLYSILNPEYISLRWINAIKAILE